MRKMLAVIGLTLGLVILGGSVVGGIALAKDHGTAQNQVPVSDTSQIGPNAPGSSDDNPAHDANDDNGNHVDAGDDNGNHPEAGDDHGGNTPTAQPTPTASDDDADDVPGSDDDPSDD
jgi:hypothetical protein